MMWITHMIFGIFLYFLAVHLGLLPYDIGYLILVGLASLVPDIDHPRSKISKALRLEKIGMMVEHRGIFHSIYALLIVSLSTYFIVYYLGYPEKAFEMGFLVAIGYSSHMISDSLTPSGICWFYPRGKVHGPIKTGSYGELLFLFIISYFLALVFLASIIGMGVNRDSLLMSFGFSILVSVIMEGEVIVRARR
ncbi:MAG: metal-dependent hydrolase [Euryarchaeota archaeon]|nr:metal-dependent hydrolase [Euryarchaeota archaeon]